MQPGRHFAYSWITRILRSALIPDAGWIDRTRIGISYEEPEVTDMLDQLLPPIRGLILDMDGVLWKDMSPIGDLSRIFDHIRLRALKVVLATNNATATADEYLEKLLRFGVALESGKLSPPRTRSHTCLQRRSRMAAQFLWWVKTV